MNTLLGEILLGEILSSEIFVRQNFRHQAKNSSLLPDEEFLPIKVKVYVVEVQLILRG